MKAARTEEGVSVVNAAVEQNPTEIPLYTQADAARYLRAPVWLVAAMWHGSFPHPEMLYHWFDGRMAGLDPDDDFLGHRGDRERWSFRRLGDLYVRVFAAESLTELGRGEPREGGRADAIGDTVRRILGGHVRVPVFFGTDTPWEGVARLLDSCRDRLNEVETLWLEKVLLLCLGRFDLEEGLPVRLFPFSRAPAEGSPRTVVMDPRIRFGRPTIAGRGIPTDVLLERYQAGDSISELAEDYAMIVPEVEEAIRYESKAPCLAFPFCV